MPLCTEEEDEAGQGTDRKYWINRGSEESVAVADSLLEMLNEIKEEDLALKYNKHYIGLSRDGVADNFMQFRARRDCLIAEFRISRSDDVTALIEESHRQPALREALGSISTAPEAPEVEANRDLLVDLIRRASNTPPPVED